MVAEHRQVVAHHIVDVNGALAHQQLRYGRRGKVDVSSIHQRDVLFAHRVSDAIDHARHVGGTAATSIVGLQPAVEIVGM